MSGLISFLPLEYIVSRNNSITISRVRLLDNPELPVDIEITGGRIAKITSSSSALSNAIDGSGKFLLPGFVDLHLQGAGKADVLDATPEALAAIARTLPRYGTTGWLATTVYEKGADNRHLALAAQMMGHDFGGGAKLLGLYLEGPFINLAKKGMIHPDWITPPDETVLDHILDLCGPALKIMTVAPELPGAVRIIEKLRQRGVTPSFGHSDADYHQTQTGIAAGIAHTTHLFNAMRPIRHRDPGPIPALIQNPNVSIELISDGAHIEPPVVDLVGKLIPPDRLCLITDGLSPLGGPDTDFVYKGRPVRSRDGVIKSHDGTLVGTAVGQSELATRFARFTNWSWPDTVRAAAGTPRAVLNLIPAGAPLIQIGQPADLVLAKIDGQALTVCATFVNGQVAFTGS